MELSRRAERQVGALRSRQDIMAFVAVNPDFLDQLRGAVSPDDTHYCSCAGGQECRQSYCVAGRFEGDLDENANRGNKAGWKYQGVPWRQT